MKSEIVDVVINRDKIIITENHKIINFSVCAIDYSRIRDNDSLTLIKIKGIDEKDFQFDFPYLSFKENQDFTYSLTAQLFGVGEIRLKPISLQTSEIKLNQKNNCYFNGRDS